MKAKRKYKIIKTEWDSGSVRYVVYVHRWHGWIEANTSGYGNSFTDLKDAKHFIKLHSGEIPEYVNTIVYEE
jgi:hypothetical protein